MSGKDWTKSMDKNPTNKIIMSSQEGGLLSSNGAYNFTRTGSLGARAKSIDSRQIASWQNDYMYQSTYATKHSQDSSKPNFKHIPGYKGFVPNVHSENLYGKTFTCISKDVLTNEKNGQNKFGLSSNGFNTARTDFIDKSQVATHRSYGKSCLQKAVPGWNVDKWVTSSRDSFRNPTKHMKDVHYDIKTPTPESRTKFSSGFARNHQFLDRTGWVPEKVLHAQKATSEYRDRFNPETEYHRNVDKPKPRKLAKKETTYAYNK